MRSPVRYLTDAEYTALPLEHRWLHEMRALVGTNEEWGNNRGKRIDEIEAHWGLKGEPYCIMACGHCLIKAGVPFVNLPKGWPLVAAAVKWAKAEGRWSQIPGRGKIFCYVKANGSGHGGAVTSVLSKTTLNTIQANTSAVGESRDGEGIFEKPLSLAYLSKFPVWGFIDVRDLDKI